MRRLIACLVFSHLSISAALAIQTSFPDGFEAYFPQIAAGGDGPSIVETIITLTNPSDEPLSFRLGGQGQFIGAQKLELAGNETREIAITRDGGLQNGFIKLTADRVLSAVVQIITRSELGLPILLPKSQSWPRNRFPNSCFPSFKIVL